MKIYASLIIVVFTIMMTATSCKKVSPVIYPPRTIKYLLYTEQNFSEDNHNITFSVSIRTHSKVLFDSTFATMKIKDIPDTLHKIIVEKKVPNDDGSELAVGFRYSIENVGI